jgi:putative phosphoesterase
MNRSLLPHGLTADRVVACLGLISDTHMPQRWPELPAAVFDVFRGVDLILHAGDVGELWVLNRLSGVAPVVAVHGNDETAEAQRELPYQQIIAIHGTRLLLCHSHLPDREAELASRAGDDWRPKLEQRAAQAVRADAAIMVLGHLHIPFTHCCHGVTLINPGAIASGNSQTRQTRQTVALLYLRDDGRPFVVHVDLARADQPYDASVDWDAGFSAIFARYNESIVEPAVDNFVAALRESAYFHDRRVWSLMSELGMPHWLGEPGLVTIDDVHATLAGAHEFSIEERADLLRLAGGTSSV